MAQNNLLKKSMKGGSSGGDGGAYLLIATVGFGLAFAVWNFVTAPFRYAYHFFITDSAWWKYILLAIQVIWVISPIGKKDSAE